MIGATLSRLPFARTVTFSEFGRRGQFANQLFHIAAVLGYAAKHRARPFLPRWVCKLSGRSYETMFPWVRQYYGHVGGHRYDEPTFAYHEIPFHKHIDLGGNFQCERYFVHIADKIRELFAEPPSIKIEIDRFCEEFGTDVFDAVHIRFYLHPLTDVALGPLERLPLAYFRAAFDLLGMDRPILVATDNKIAAESLLAQCAVGKTIKVLRFADPLCDFYTLSRARRIAIANSSFSWWAAWLGPQKEEIIAPHRYYWFDREARNNPFWDVRDLYPATFNELVV